MTGMEPLFAYFVCSLHLGIKTRFGQTRGNLLTSAGVVLDGSRTGTSQYLEATARDTRKIPSTASTSIVRALGFYIGSNDSGLDHILLFWVLVCSGSIGPEKANRTIVFSERSYVGEGR